MKRALKEVVELRLKEERAIKKAEANDTVSKLEAVKRSQKKLRDELGSFNKEMQNE